MIYSLVSTTRTLPASYATFRDRRMPLSRIGSHWIAITGRRANNHPIRDKADTLGEMLRYVRVTRGIGDQSK